MLDSSIYFFIQNVFVITTLFWFLSFIGEKFFKKKQYINSYEVFECGFSSTHELDLTFNYNFFITAVLLILYDIEFFYMLPVAFNFHLINIFVAFTFLCFIIFIVLSFVYDWEMITLD